MIDPETSFEEAVDQLERIVSRMESGSLTLDESLAQFQQAVALSRHCAEKLDRAEKQVAVLTREERLRNADGMPWETGEAEDGAGGGY